jgi:hypothetical protein
MSVGTIKQKSSSNQDFYFHILKIMCYPINTDETYAMQKLSVTNIFLLKITLKNYFYAL